MQATRSAALASHSNSRRRAVPRVVALALTAMLVAACGGASEVDDAGTQPSDTAAPSTEVDEPSDDTEEPATDDTSGTDPTDDSSDDGSGDATDGPSDPDGSTDPGATDDAPDTEDDGDGDTGTLTTSFDADEVTVLGTDGSVLARFEVPDTRLDAFADVVTRPGATASELDAIVVVLRGEVYRLYHLEVTGGETAELTEAPDHLQPQDAMEATMTLRWTPDADSVLWTEPTSDGVTLRSFGWDDGPGTDRPADDNAAFALDLPADVSIDGFEVLDDDRWIVQLVDGLGMTHELEMERQADGALALP